ncbi:MAG: UvrB/UvrC motif-containing protein [Patescibacteria group bacterium]
MLRQDFDKIKLPDTPGVYLFRQGRDVLYIGKATSLADRVKSYFAPDLILTRGQRLVKMLAEASRVTFEETDSVLEALIREAALIKKYQPVYNSREKDDKSFNYVVITKEEYPRVFTMRERELLTIKKTSFEAMYGPFPNGGQLRDALKIIRKIFPYRGKTDAPLATAKRRASRLYEEIGLAPKSKAILADAGLYKKTIRNVKLFFEGKKKALLKTLEKDMRAYARAHEFEKAAEIKRQLFALQHINDIALIKRGTKNNEQGTKEERIEGYDVAHTSGAHAVGVMTVVYGSEPARSDYRMFNIKGLGEKGRIVDDTKALSEILDRRFGHPEWPLPRCIVVDGSTAQKRAAERVLLRLGLLIPVVAVVKDERHRPQRLLGDARLTHTHASAIITVNAEAHRFALSFHRKKRRFA